MKYFEELITEKVQLSSLTNSYSQTLKAIIDSIKKEGKLFTCGNGGSASDAEHIAGELLKGFALQREIPEEFFKNLNKSCPQDAELYRKNLQRGIPCISLMGHPSFMTAYANDKDSILSVAQHLYALGKPGDVVLGISTSGNSKNIVHAFNVAKAMGITTIGLTGDMGGRLNEIADICLRAPESEVHKIQELHLPIYHALCLDLEHHFFA